MLPIFKNKMQPGLMVKHRSPDEKSEAEKETQSEDHNELEAAAKELCEAVEAKDHKAVAKAFHRAFKAAELMPHDEAEHEETEASPHTYDAQNQKAAFERQD